MRDKEDKIEDLLRAVRVVVSGVDGVLAKFIHLMDDGTEIKRFCEKDRPRIDMLTSTGVAFVLISGRDSGATQARADEMNVSFYPRQSLGRKPAEQLQRLCEKHNVTPDRILYLGDDIGDIRWMERVGVAAAPSDANYECLKRAHIVAEAKGGEGAVSEILTRLMRVQGTYDAALARFLE